jgi:hypothetical protein
MIETEQSIKRDPMKMIEDPPTHMLFELDFTCMFNMINREVTAELLETEMPELYHYFWATYGHPLKHYYAQEMVKRERSHRKKVSFREDQ